MSGVYTHANKHLDTKKKLKINKSFMKICSHNLKSGVAVHTYDSSTWEAGGRKSVQVSLLLHSVFEASLRPLFKIFI